MNRQQEIIGFRFLFADLVKETRALRNIAEDFINPGTLWTLKRLCDDLYRFSKAQQNRVFRLELQPLWTNISKGEYEASGRRGLRQVYAIISGSWDLRPLGNESQNRKVEFCGIASTRIELYASDDPCTRLAMWRLEWGANDSPGCYVHAQILGDSDDPPFPQTVPVPRLPSIFVTPMGAVEFAFGELFQDKWAKATAGNTHYPQYWRARQRELLLCLFSWHRGHLENKNNGSPWMALKKAKPKGELFLED